jgi:hypothetical protein
MNLHLKIRIEGPNAARGGPTIISEAVEVRDLAHARRMVEDSYYRDEDTLHEVVSAVLCVEEVRLV